jgi:hypothetical protein
MRPFTSVDAVEPDDLIVCSSPPSSVLVSSFSVEAELLSRMSSMSSREAEDELSWVSSGSEEEWLSEEQAERVVIASDIPRIQKNLMRTSIILLKEYNKN